MLTFPEATQLTVDIKLSSFYQLGSFYWQIADFLATSFCVFFMEAFSESQTKQTKTFQVIV